MTNRQLLTYFKQYINYFDNVRESDFDALAKLDNNLFSFNTGEEYIVTPLLKQISEYSTILNILSGELSEELSRDIQKESLKNILEFITNCSYYINRSVSMGYQHPSIFLNACMNNICVLYQDMHETAHQISINVMTENEVNADSLFTYFNQLTNIVYDNIDNNFDETISSITDADMISEKDILLLLKSYSTNVFRGLALFNGVNQYASKSKNIVFTNSGNETLYLFDIISLASSLKEKIQDPILVLLINKLLDEYKIYSSFRYQYLRMHHNEQVYLQKYKKYKS